MFTIKRTLFCLSLLAAAPLTALADEAPVPPNNFDAFVTSADGAYEFANSCTQSLSHSSFDTILSELAPNMVTVNSSPDEKKPLLIVTQKRIVCLHKTDSGNIVVPLEALDQTIDFTDMPASETREMRIDIAKQLAKSGYATATVVYEAGTAYQLIYFIPSNHDTKLLYRLNFLKKGTFENDLPAKTYKGTGNVSTVGRSSRNGISELSRNLY